MDRNECQRSRPNHYKLRSVGKCDLPAPGERCRVSVSCYLNPAAIRLSHAAGRSQLATGEGARALDPGKSEVDRARGRAATNSQYAAIHGCRRLCESSWRTMSAFST